MNKSGNVASHCDPSLCLDPSPAELKMTPAFDLSSDPSRHKVTSRVQTYAATATWQLGKM